MAAEEGSVSGGGGGWSGGDRKSSPAPAKPGGGGAAKFLAGMPSRGNFSSGSVSSSLGGFRVYVCEHSTDPPGQWSLGYVVMSWVFVFSEKKCCVSCAQNVSAARSLDVNNSAKRANLGTPSGSSVYEFQENNMLHSCFCPNPAYIVIFLESYGYFNLAEEPISGFSQHTLQSFTVERLRGLLRQGGLSTKGKKARETLLNLLVLKEFAKILFKIIMTSASFDFLLHL
ncbi:hypothetical protein BAE44_0019829 [Dichanthelium oligosanthes]|uniref:Uncharacterized protein n=1 Tax=Dichanthelium oligosanthes TaxID=888268 RepID=A0A1E5V1W9_9POAL|nr:hypothetical protein BAE44_0019829 [Dichanthelium oligosanthes]